MEVTTTKTKKSKSRVATGLGIAITIITALEVIDFNVFSLTNPNDIKKLLIVLLPAIHGILTTTK